MKRSIKNGFTMIEALLALLVAGIFSLCVLVFVQTCLKTLQLDTLHQEQMAILQLRQILALSKDIQVDPSFLTMNYRHEEIWIGQDKDRLVRKDGYEILMEGVNQIEFTQEKEEIFMHWKKKEKEFTIQLR